MIDKFGVRVHHGDRGAGRGEGGAGGTGAGHQRSLSSDKAAEALMNHDASKSGQL